MIFDANGNLARRRTETTFPKELVQKLIDLAPLLAQNGLSLFCLKCHRLGLPDGVKGDNRPESDTYKLSCGCSTRVFHKVTGHEKVAVH